MTLNKHRTISGNIPQVKCYSIMGDETPDTSGKEQLVLCIRWSVNDLQVCEGSVGLHRIPSISANVAHVAHEFIEHWRCH